MTTNISSLSCLPEELLVKIFFHLTEKEAAALGSTSRLFLRIFQDPILQEHFHVQEHLDVRRLQHKPLVGRKINPFLDPQVPQEMSGWAWDWKNWGRDRVFVTDRYLVACRKEGRKDRACARDEDASASSFFFTTTVSDLVADTTVKGALTIPAPAIDQTSVLSNNRLMYYTKKEIVMWDIKTQEITCLEPLRDDRIIASSLLSDGRIAFAHHSAVVGERPSVVVWNYKTEERINLECSPSVCSVFFLRMSTYDSTRVMCDMRGHFANEQEYFFVNIWDPDAPTQPVYQLSDLARATSGAFGMPDLALGSDKLVICNHTSGEIRIWDYTRFPAVDISEITPIRKLTNDPTKHLVLSRCQRWIIGSTKSGRIEAQSLENTDAILPLRGTYQRLAACCLDWSAPSPFVMTKRGTFLFPADEGDHFCMWHPERQDVCTTTPAFGKRGASTWLVPDTLQGYTKPPFCHITHNLFLSGRTIVFGTGADPHYSQLLFSLDTLSDDVATGGDSTRRCCAIA